MRIRLLLLSAGLLFNSLLSAQTTFWNEDFGTGCSQGNLAAGTVTGMGTWTITNVTAPDPNANQWYISAPEAGMGVGSCGDGCLNNAALTNRTLHISNVSTSPLAFILCPTGDCGAAYDAGVGAGDVAVNVRAESPLINCTGRTTITLNFAYLQGGTVGVDFMEVMYSDNGGTTWNSLSTPGSTVNGGCSGGQGLWTAFSVALPASCDNNANVKIGFRWQNNDDGAGTDPSVAIDDVILTVPSAAVPVASISPSPNDSLCQNSTLTLNGSATNGPILSWAWTANPSAGVTFTPNASAQNPTVTFTTPGSYTFSLVATNGAGASAPATQTITILAAAVPTVTITASPVNPVCAGTAVNFTATPTNGGTAPSYTWQVNGVTAGSNSPNFSSATLNNNDVITVTVTSNDTCISAATANDSYTVQITPSVVPSVTIAASATTACAGSPISFTATPTNGGLTPAYQWQVNGVSAGSNSPNFSSAFANGDAITVILTSNAVCPSPATATSNTITVVITPTVAPTATITALPNNPVCPGTLVNFTATPTNGGATPVYQWQVNAVNAGSNSPNYSSSTLTNNDVVSVLVTSNAACVTPTTVTATYTMVVATPTIGVTGTATVCPGISDTLTASAGAGSTFSWTPAAGLNATNNDTAIATNNNPGVFTYYVTATLNGCSITDSVKVTVTNFTVSAGPTLTICSGNSANLSVSAGTSWNWTPIASLNCDTCQNPVATPTATTTYTVIADNGICTDTAIQQVIVIPTASASFNSAIVTPGLPQVIGFTNTSQNANTFFWTLGNGNTSVLQTPANQTYNVAGTYTVTLIAYGTNGCNDTISTLLFVNDSVGITVPNIFTPNGDEINDVWQPSVHGATSLECTIFNRWGVQVYEFIGPQDKWDGRTTAALICTEGTYYYMLKATDSNNKSYNLKGFIQLIR